ncbi:hypothetical protein [Sphingomonas sp. NIBR02145]|uniref:hypothetical protein n=1 Tax=Sphingomonas sp. NIBR02145 TaxID=3014784 RepID=UPI0022B43C42|nr:hypothetical protein [Sphingomonas sp. NIBR02145]WHU01035.1 hypothetical protein O3305_12490 [Sphingomonas sp. NIBR02145]WHU04233.1 hypothetical protein O3305_06495 [Sphingomonas sp. NIBR02145]
MSPTINDSTGHPSNISLMSNQRFVGWMFISLDQSHGLKNFRCTSFIAWWL